MQAMNTEKVRDSRSRTSSRRQRPKNGGIDNAEFAHVDDGAGRGIRRTATTGIMRIANCGHSHPALAKMGSA